MTDIRFRVPLNNSPLKTPRKIRVVCIGAGFAGLTLAYKVSHGLKLEDVIDFRIYERQVGYLFRFITSGKRTLTCSGILWGHLGSEQISGFDLRRTDSYLFPAVGTQT
jgi:hypothetical protein